MKSLMKTISLLPPISFGLLFGVFANAVTPTALEVAKLLASDGEIVDNFGYSLAVDGDTVVVGAPGDDDIGENAGAAYVFIRSGSSWIQQAKLTASDGEVADDFAYSVAIDGDTIVIGSRYDDDNAVGAGSAYVFTRSGTAWTQQAKLLASDGDWNDEFGYSVAVSEGTAIISAIGDNETSGAVYVFTRSGSTWTEVVKLTASDDEYGDHFGNSVALDGDTVVISALLGDSDTILDTGAAYVFIRNGTTWSEQAKLTASDGETNDYFGWSVDLDGDTAVIGARWDDDQGLNAGAAYIFVREETIWTEKAKLIASDGGNNDSFGWSVAVAGDTAAIAAPHDNEDRSGSVYVFSHSAGIWSETLRLITSDAQLDDRLGYFNNAIALYDYMVVAGSPYNNEATGAVYVFNTIPDNAGPITSDVLVNPNPAEIETFLEITANIDDSTTGGSMIESASYTINGGMAISMTASDGDFDEAEENVSAAVTDGLPVGAYDVCVFGTDTAGNIGAESCTFLAVYDPSAGFVTGAGWFNSPPGAYIADSGLTGKATFSFVTQYINDQSVPEGNTEFKFQAGDLKFHTLSYEWLVVANAKAMFKGVGIINGAGNYGFMVMAIDEALTLSTDVDLLRIKIWDRDNGDSVVYDNEFGSADTEDPVTAINAGSIRIHP